MCFHEIRYVKSFNGYQSFRKPEDVLISVYPLPDEKCQIKIARTVEDPVPRCVFSFDTYRKIAFGHRVEYTWNVG